MDSALHTITIIASMGIIGGLIGYTTNVIAVKMLFRPRKPYCVLNGRICVQGVIPARRDAIVSRLAEIASSHILSGEMRQRVSSVLEEKLREVIANIVMDNILRYTPRNTIAVKLSKVIAEAIAETVTPRILKFYEEAASRIDPRDLIVDQLNSLTIDEVEEIFYKLAGRELRFIELAGLLLGVIIGVMEGIIVLVISQ